MHVWIVQTGEPLPCDEGVSRGMRAMNAAKYLVDAGHRVTLWSSDFFHQEKRHRYGQSKTIKISKLLTVRLIPSCGYLKNVSLKRFKDHKQLAKNFLEEITKESLPDVALVGFPPIEIAHAAVTYLKSKNVPVLLDVKDQWPDIFSDGVPPIGMKVAKFLLRRLHKQSVDTMKKATSLSAMSVGFLEWAAERAGRSVTTQDLVCPLTTPTPIVSGEELAQASSWWRDRGIKKTEKLRLIFVGSLSRQFDLMTALDGVCQAASTGIPVEAVICGSGEMEKALREKFQNEPSIVFAGWIDFPKYKTLATISDVSLAPYVVTEAFQLSIPNKVIDAFSFALPIFTPLGGEVGELISGKGVGWVYEEKSPNSVSELLFKIITNRSELSEKSNAAITLFETQFNFDSVYGELEHRLTKLAFSFK
jgi:glycosyltransferase involved in cell wall biosynthesis